MSGLSNYISSESSVLALGTGFAAATIVSGLAYMYQLVNYPSQLHPHMPPHAFRNWARNMVAGTILSIPRAWSVLKHPDDLGLMNLSKQIKELNLFYPTSPLINSLSLTLNQLSDQIFYNSFLGMGKDLVVIGASLWGGYLVGKCNGIWRQSPTTSLFVAMATGFATQDGLLRIGMGLAATSGILLGMRIGALVTKGMPYRRTLCIASMVAGALIGVNMVGFAAGESAKTHLVSSVAALIGARLHHRPWKNLQLTLL